MSNFILVKLEVDLEFILGILDGRRDYTLDGHMHTHTPRGNLA